MRPELPLERQWEEAIADRLSEAVAALVAGEPERAQTTLDAVRVRGPARVRRQEVSRPTQLAVFRRDSFHCRYCGQKTLFLPTVRALSDLFPDHLPVDPGWKLDHTHPVYWTLIASPDHVIPAIRGGGSDEANLVTSCWRCNDIKRAWSLQELRWSLLDPVIDRDWDGLSSAFPDLCALRNREGQGLSERAYFKSWLRAFAPSG